MIYLDDKLPGHRKILAAGRLIGDAHGGRSAALGLFVAAIGYAREYLTDGVVPDEFLYDFAKNRAAVDALRRVRLIRKMRGNSYRIHDFHDWNKSAEKIKKNRDQNRIRQQRFYAKRAGSNGNLTPLANGVSTHAPNPQSPIPIKARKSSARARATPSGGRKRDLPTERQLLKLVHTAIDSHPDDGIADVKAEVREQLAAKGFASVDATALGNLVELAMKTRTVQ